MFKYIHVRMIKILLFHFLIKLHQLFAELKYFLLNSFFFVFNILMLLKNVVSLFSTMYNISRKLITKFDEYRILPLERQVIFNLLLL